MSPTFLACSPSSCDTASLKTGIWASALVSLSCSGRNGSLEKLKHCASQGAWAMGAGLTYSALSLACGGPRPGLLVPLSCWRPQLSGTGVSGVSSSRASLLSCRGDSGLLLAWHPVRKGFCAQNGTPPALPRSAVILGWLDGCLWDSQARPQREAWQSKNMPFRPSGRCELHHCIFLSSLCPLGIKNLNIGIVSQSWLISYLKNLPRKGAGNSRE